MQNWQAFKSLATAHLTYLRREHPTWSLQDLFTHLKLPATPLLERTAVECGFVSQVPAGYGQTPFGSSPYGSNRRKSNGVSAVSRKVTRSGQLYYRGYRYTLGVRYGNRQALLLERGARLTVSFVDQPPLDLAARHWVAQ